MSPHCTQVAGFTKGYWIPGGGGVAAGSSLRRILAGPAWERQGLDSSRRETSGERCPALGHEEGDGGGGAGRTQGEAQAEEKAWGSQGREEAGEQPSQRLRGKTTSGIPPGPQEARGGGWGDGGLGPLATGRLGKHTCHSSTSLARCSGCPCSPRKPQGGPPVGGA